MQVEIMSDGALATISTKGAELQSLKDVLGTEYLWQGNPEYWTGRSPILFPVVGRLVGGKYVYGGKEYTFGCHGFAKLNEFQLIAQEKNRAVFQLSSNPELLKIYPFHFQFQVAYTLEHAGLKVEFTVKNTGDDDMLFSVGGHPAFNVPLLPDEKFEDYEIEFEKEENLDVCVHDENVLTTGETRRVMTGSKVLPLTHELFYNDALVPVKMDSKVATLKSRKSGRGIQMDFHGFKYMAIWTPPKKQAPFVCLEPWIGSGSGAHDSCELKDRRDIMTLPAQKAFSVSYQLQLL